MATMANATETYHDPQNGLAPNTAANSARINTHLSPDQPLASSPILKDNENIPSRWGLTASERTSRASSIRISRDLDSLLWQGSHFDDSDFAEDDGFLKPDDEVDMLASDDSRRASMQDGVESLVLSRQSTNELNSYSALSKRADFILASAKRKLNLLEGDIKGARHSLMAPPRTGHALTPSNSLRGPSSNAQAEENRQYGRTAYTNSNESGDAALTRALHGHTRVFSETSVPSPRGPAVKGSLGLEHVRNRYPVQSHSTELTNDRSLGPVIEDEVSTEWNDEPQATRQTEPTSTLTTSNAQILRNEADDLRDRLSMIQERVRNDVLKRRSLQGPSQDRNSRDLSIAQQILALRQSLDQQEEVIEQLERAEGGEVVGPADEAEGSRDPREEWQQILHHDEDRYDEDANSQDEYSEEDEAEFQSVLEQQQFDEEDPDMDGAHEDRADAFDYEHFILHSVLGNYSNLVRSQRSSSPSGQSNSTERGDGEQEFEEEGEEEEEDDDTDPAEVQTKSLQHEESIASFATAQQHANGSSDIDSSPDEEAANDEEPRSIRDEHGNSWPMPPSSNGSRHASTVFSEGSQPTLTGNHFSEANTRNGKNPMTGHRPASRIFSALMGPISTSSTLPKLDEDDQSLVYAIAEALRNACVKLQRHPLDEQQGIDWRQRMEEARRILAGEQNLSF